MILAVLLFIAMAIVNLIITGVEVSKIDKDDAEYLASLDARTKR